MVTDVGVDIAHLVMDVVDVTNESGKVGTSMLDTSLGGSNGVSDSVVLDGTEAVEVVESTSLVTV